MSSQSEPPKIVTLTERLLDRTRRGELKWEVTDRDEAFATVLQGGSIVVSKLVTQYTIAVRNERGALIEEADVSPEYAASPIEVALARALPTLHETVRRQVLDVDRTLDNILDQLG